jgi:hypothetical protein
MRAVKGRSSLVFLGIEISIHTVRCQLITYMDDIARYPSPKSAETIQRDRGEYLNTPISTARSTVQQYFMDMSYQRR